jgi:hypothetical protein
MMSSMIASSRPATVLVDGEGPLGRLADFTLGTAVVLWHLALAGHDRRRRRAQIRAWSSTR